MADEIQAMSAAVPSASETDATPASPTIETPAVEPKIDLAQIEAPKAATTPVEMTAGAPRAEIKMTADAGPSPRADIAAEAAAVSGIIDSPARGNRFALLAASVALAAALGAVAGALSASGLTRVGPTPSEMPITAAVSGETVALQSTIAQMQTELAALRTSVEAATRATNGQFAKITERFDRVERTQTERAAKFIKAVETLERLERRADVVPAKEATGSVPAPQPVAAAPAPPLPTAAPVPQQPPIVEGWVVRNVYRGTAIIQNRRIGTIDVEPGDVLPGVGRVESIKKQDGRWVVVTSKGLITSMR